MEFGCEGQAGKIKVISMVDIAAAYASGKLAQIVS
jgi:fructose-bisphosphate aldolase, class II